MKFLRSINEPLRTMTIWRIWSFTIRQIIFLRAKGIFHLIIEYNERCLPLCLLHKCRYQKWIDRFSPSTNHLVLNDSNTCMGSSSVHRVQYKLNLLSEELFPLLGDTGSLYEDDVCI